MVAGSADQFAYDKTRFRALNAAACSLFIFVFILQLGIDRTWNLHLHLHIRARAMDLSPSIVGKTENAGTHVLGRKALRSQAIRAVDV